METQLTKENIQLIRDFLQKNGVAHTDILHELTDHVASACETLMKTQNKSFLEVFVPYMRVNGAILIDKAYPMFDSSPFKAFFSFCKNHYFFGGLFFLIFIYQSFFSKVEFDIFKIYIPTMMVLSCLAILPISYTRWILKMKLLKIERLYFVFTLFYLGFIIAFNFNLSIQNIIGIATIYITLWVIAFTYHSTLKIIQKEKVWL